MKARQKSGCLTKIIATSLQTIHLNYNPLSKRLTSTPVLIPIITIPIGEEMDLTAERLLLAYQIVNLVLQTGENGEERMNVYPTPN